MYSDNAAVNSVQPTVGYKSLTFSAPDSTNTFVTLTPSVNTITVNSTFWSMARAAMISINNLSASVSNFSSLEMSVKMDIKSATSTGPYQGVLCFRWDNPTNNTSNYTQYSVQFVTTPDGSNANNEIITDFVRTSGSINYAVIESVNGSSGQFHENQRNIRNITVELKNPGSSNVALVTVSTAPNDATFRLSFMFTRPIGGYAIGQIQSIPSSPPIGQTTYNNQCYNLLTSSNGFRSFGIMNKVSCDDIFMPLNTTLTWANSSSTTPTIDGTATYNSTTPVELGSIRAVSGMNLIVTAPIPVLLNGNYSLAYPQAATTPVQIPLTSITGMTTAQLVNRTIYLYFSSSSAGPVILASLTTLPETMGQTYIGTVTTGLISITNINVLPVYRLLTYRLSTTATGSAIPVSTGLPSATTGTHW